MGWLRGCDHELDSLGFYKDDEFIDTQKDQLVVILRERLLCPSCGVTAEGEATKRIRYRLERIDGQRA